MATPALIPVYEPSEAIERHASRVRFYAAASRAENTIRTFKVSRKGRLGKYSV